MEKEKVKRAYVQLPRVTLSDGLALIPELIEEEEPPKAISPDEGRERNEGYGGDAGEGELRHGVVGAAVAAVAVGAGENEMR